MLTFRADTLESRIRCISFDAAGTLVHYRPSFSALFATTCRRHGLDIDSRRVARASRAGMELLHGAAAARCFTDPESTRRLWADVYRRILRALGYSDELVVAELLLVLSDPGAYAAYDDVHETLSALQAAGFRLLVVSNFEPWLADVLQRLDLAQYFDCVLISAVERLAKPDPEIFRRALGRQNVPAGALLHVGDSYDHDVAAPRAVGLRSVLLDRRRETSEADTLRSLRELPALLETLEGTERGRARARS